MTAAEHTRRTVKMVVAGFLYYTGLLRLFRSSKTRQYAVMVMYHRVVDERNPPNDYSRADIVVRKNTFDKHLRYMKKHYHVVTLSQLLAHMQGDGPIPNGLCGMIFATAPQKLPRNC